MRRFFRSMVTTHPHRGLLITADDFGLCDDVNVATMAVLERGLVSAAEIMPTAPSFEAAAALVRRRDDLDVGVHLTLTSEFRRRRWGPLTPAERVPSLVDERGFFPFRCEDVAARATVAEILVESHAQVRRVLAAGLRPSHVTQHMFVLDQMSTDGAAAVEVLGALHATYGFAARVTNHAAAKELSTAGVPVVWDVATDTHDVSMADRPAYYERLVREAGRAEDSPFELIVHCGRDTEAMRSFTTAGPRRAQDAALLLGGGIAAAAEAAGVRLVSWRSLSSRGR